MEKKAAVTTPRGRDDLLALAKTHAERMGIPVIPRNYLSFDKIMREHSLAGLWVVTDEQPIVQTQIGPIIYHEGSAVLRAHKRRTEQDAIIRALRIEPADTILDCTLGMAIDSLVAATGLGEGGKIIGLESSLLLHFLVKNGIETHEYQTKLLDDAAHRIEPVLSDHKAFLENCPPNEFDAVYFDPMFEKTVKASAMMHRIREVADEQPMDGDTIRLALRAARRCVVVKGRRGVFSDLEFDEFIPSGGNVFYGVVNA